MEEKAAIMLKFCVLPAEQNHSHPKMSHSQRGDIKKTWWTMLVYAVAILVKLLTQLAKAVNRANRANCDIILWRLVYSLSAVIYVSFLAMLATLAITATGSQIKVLLLERDGKKNQFSSVCPISCKHIQYVLLFLNRYISNSCSPLPVPVCVSHVIGVI